MIEVHLWQLVVSHVAVCLGSAVAGVIVFLAWFGSKWGDGE